MLQENYRTVYQGGSGEIIEKKSRFIANILPVTTEEEALAFIERMKKTYWDARHNCSAYVIGFHPELQRCSDDGEPAKTAGRPILDVLINEGLRNTAVVVTRYFGGTLLGTGGLVRAYTEAVKAGLANSTIIEKQFGHRLMIQTDYNGIGKLQYLAAQADLKLLTTDYTDIVTCTLFVTPDAEPAFLKKWNEQTSGQSLVERLEPCFCAMLDGSPVLFPE